MSTTETAQPQNPNVDVEDVPRFELKDYPQDGQIWVWYKNETRPDEKRTQRTSGWIPYMAATCVFHTLPAWAFTVNNIIVRGVAGVTHLVDPDRGVPRQSHLLRANATDHLNRWKSILSDLDGVGLVEDTKMLILDYDEESWMYIVTASTTPPGYCYLHAMYNSMKECAGGIKLLAQNPLLHAAAEQYGEIIKSAQSKCVLDTVKFPPLAICQHETDISSKFSIDGDEINAARKLWLHA
jgi:hypothetical protein